jgi:hypothetical protein
MAGIMSWPSINRVPFPANGTSLIVLDNGMSSSVKLRAARTRAATSAPIAGKRGLVESSMRMGADDA